ncbi:MAG: hypothetical protein ACREKL_11100 [Chthoniobacterales bacterium]
MKFLLAFLMLPFLAAAEPPPVLTPLKYRVLLDQRTYIRQLSDIRCCVWTDKSPDATPLLGSLGVRTAEAVTLQKGEVLAVFLNDTITETLTAMIHNETADGIFADYADSGLMFKLVAPPARMKYSHLTVVVFSPTKPVSQIGIRGMIPHVLAEKYPPNAK